MTMKIELVFPNISHDIEDATVEFFFEDASEADAPAQQLLFHRIASIRIPQSKPTVTIELDPTLPKDPLDISLFVRVEALVLGQTVAKFINTTTTPISGDPNEFVRASLERIR